MGGFFIMFAVIKMPAMIRQSLALVLSAALLIPASSARESVPDWLAGTPNLEIRTQRCHLYQWITRQADKQTGSRTDKHPLARKRLINLANKLVDHHLATDADTYSAELRYLVIGKDAPAHFHFHINAEQLDQLLDDDCHE